MTAIPTSTEACRVGDLVEFRWWTRGRVMIELGVVTCRERDRTFAMWADRENNDLLEQSFELSTGVVDWLTR